MNDGHNHGNVLTESDGTSTKTYTYTPYDARSSYTLTMNGVLMESETYTYDAAGRLVQVDTDYATVTHTYDSKGNRTQDLTVLANGTPLSQQNYTYDAANRVVSVVSYVASGSTVLTPVNESYTYYRDGSMYTKTSGGVTTTYTYDGAGRLTNENSGTSSISYAYDAANNRTSMVNNGTLTTYTYDANNRMLTETEGGTTKTYTYDANGNQLTGDGATYTYNARGQQTGYSKGSVTASYTYLPTGLRKSKTVGITTTNYVWDGQNMVYEYNGTNSTGGTAYYYGLTLISQGNYAYYLYNAHGDVVQLISSTGSLGLSYNYDAFGNEVNPSATDTNPFRYAGQYFDAETGTYYLRARYYNPSVGRFTQQDGWQFSDPNDPLSLNLYTYCLNNPVVDIDLTGHMPVSALNSLSWMYNNNHIGREYVTSAALMMNINNIYTGFHEIAQVHLAKYLYSLGYSPQLEYRVPHGEVDVVAGAMAWEIKPFYLSGGAQLLRYLDGSSLSIGHSFSPIVDIPIFGKYKMMVYPSPSEPGVASYALYYLNHQKEKVIVSSSVVVKELKKQAVIAGAVAGGIIALTLLEDVVTGGAGVADDVPSIVAALGLGAKILGLV